MVRTIAIGMLAAAFAMSLEGGHWVWTASLRYAYMLVFLSLGLIFFKGTNRFLEVLGVFVEHWFFWMLAGCMGFGVFYSLLSLSASYAAGWMVATTWQMTILATPIVLAGFGRRVTSKGLLLIGLVFMGIVLVNIEHAISSSMEEVILGGFPVLIAAFSYPIGNQMVWEARLGGKGPIPRISSAVVEDSFACVLLLTIGSIPFWIVLVLVTAPPPPSSGQLINTAMVALLSGVIATSLFLHARNLCAHAGEIAAVDATQAMEVVFSLMGEIVFLQGVFPSMIGMAGVALTTLGLMAYARLQAASQGA